MSASDGYWISLELLHQAPPIQRSQAYLHGPDVANSLQPPSWSGDAPASQSSQTPHGLDLAAGAISEIAAHAVETRRLRIEQGDAGASTQVDPDLAMLCGAAKQRNRDGRGALRRGTGREWS